MKHNDDNSTSYPGESSPQSDRDARGRWLKGHCPNPKGRPRKKPRWQTDTDDLQIFGNTLIDVRMNGKTELMLRRVALLEKIFEEGMKGKVSMLKFLHQLFEKHDERMAEIRNYHDRLIRKWILDNPKHKDPHYELPREIELEIIQVRSFLKHYYPGSYGDPE